MNICIAGWYFRPIVEQLKGQSKYPCTVVAHRGEGAIPNVGLEFGCYQHYLENLWNGGDTFFLHDDNEIAPEALDKVADIKFDHCFLFSSQEEAKSNCYAHGRAFFCSDKLLRKLYVDGGFWYDEGNHGDTSITHNNGIRMFKAWLDSLPLDIGHIGIVPGLQTGYRGSVDATSKE